MTYQCTICSNGETYTLQDFASHLATKYITEGEITMDRNGGSHFSKKDTILCSRCTQFMEIELHTTEYSSKNAESKIHAKTIQSVIQQLRVHHNEVCERYFLKQQRNQILERRNDLFERLIFAIEEK